VGHLAAGISANPSDYLQKWWKTRRAQISQQTLIPDQKWGQNEVLAQEA
jgi:hypothetical protein